MTIDEMKKRKEELGYSCERLAELSQVPLGTVQKIFSGITKRPRFDTLRALERVLYVSPETSYSQPLPSGSVQEPLFQYTLSKPGSFSVSDYYSLPQDRRAELIDGVLYDMAAPSYLHQLISGEIYVRLREHIRNSKGNCIVTQAPADVQLDCDDRTMLQPDIMIVCDRTKIRNHCLYGAPDFVAEILSQATRRRDMGLKLQKYMEAGVREYWLVDPDRCKVVVYDLEHEELPVIYGFDSQIPVLIWNGECRIDFQEIYSYVQFLYKE